MYLYNKDGKPYEKDIHYLLDKRIIKPGELVIAAENAYWFIEEIINKEFGLINPEFYDWSDYIHYCYCDGYHFSQKLYFFAHSKLNLKKLNADKIRKLIDRLGCVNIEIKIYSNLDDEDGVTHPTTSYPVSKKYFVDQINMGWYDTKVKEYVVGIDGDEEFPFLKVKEALKYKIFNILDYNDRSMKISSFLRTGELDDIVKPINSQIFVCDSSHTKILAKKNL